MPLFVIEALDTYTPAENLAYNEALLNEVERQSPLLRIFTFSEPGLILARNEDIWDVRKSYHPITTRRNTGGSVMYVDENTLGYTLLFDQRDMTNDLGIIYKAMTQPLVSGLREQGIVAELGNLFSIRIEGKVIGGHAQYRPLQIRGAQYDGIVNLKSPDVEKLDAMIRLRRLALHNNKKVLCIDGNVYDLKGKLLGKEREFELTTLRDERSEIAQMRGLEDYEISRDEYVTILKRAFGSVFGMNAIDYHLSENVCELAKKLQIQKYKNEEWVVHRGGRKGQGYCFVDLIEPEEG